MNENLLKSVQYRNFVSLGAILIWAGKWPDRTVVKNNHVIGVLSPTLRTIFMPDAPCPVAYLPKIERRLSCQVKKRHSIGKSL